MNTYLVPTTEEFGNVYKNIIVIYAESEKEAYQKAIFQKDYQHVIFKNIQIILMKHFIKNLRFQKNSFLYQEKMLY